MSVKKREERATRVNLGGLDLSVENPKSAFPKEKRNSTWGQRKSQNEKRGTQHEGKGKLNTRENETQHKGKGKINMEEKGKLNMRAKGNSTWGKKGNSTPKQRETHHSKCSHPKIFPWKRMFCPYTEQPWLQQEKQELGSNKRLRKNKNLSRYPRFCI